MIDSLFGLVAENALIPICIAAWRSLPLFGVALVFQLLTRRRIAARYHCLLWMLVVVRLMVPYSVPFPSSIQPHFDRIAEQLIFGEPNDEVAISNHPDAHHNESDQFAATPGEHENSPVVESSVYSIEPTESVAIESVVDWGLIVACSILVLWPLGATFLIGRSLITYIRFALRLKRCSEVTDQFVIDLVLRVCDELRIGRRPKLKEVPWLSVPAVFGLFKPVVCIPSAALQELSQDQLKWVLLHELGHVRRRDPLVLAIAVFARAVHWFNPLAWLTVSRLRACMELAADEIVVRHVPDRSVADYGRILVHYASKGLQNRHVATMGLIFMAADQSLKKRIMMLDAHRHRSRWMQCVGALIVLVAAATGLTEAHVFAVSERPEIHLPVFSSSQGNLLPKTTNDRPLEKITFDVSKALESVGRLHPEKDAEQELLAHFQMYVPDRSEIVDGTVTFEVTDKTRQTIQRLLKAVERGGLRQVMIACRLMTVTDKVINKLSWLDDAILAKLRIDGPRGSQFPFESLLQSETPFQPTFQVQQGMIQSCPVFDSTITDQQAHDLIKMVQSDRRSNIMFSPKVTLFNGQFASIQDLTQRPFVTNMRPAGDVGSDMEPVVELVSDGTSIELIADVTETMDIELQAVVTLSQTQQVELANLPFASRDNPEANVTVQVPSVNRMLIRSNVRLSDGESLLIAVPQAFSADEANTNFSPATTLIMLTPRIIPY